MKQAPRNRSRGPLGIGQLSLVEHALCPLSASASLQENYVHEAGYSYSDNDSKRCRAQARVLCPLGLSAADELYLWGLLALTLQQPEPVPELRATPHWCLRQLQLIDCTNKRGGRQYAAFREALRRLATVRYLNDAFYDPIRQEHRQVCFGFFSYSLPQATESQRAWRIAWDPLFFELVKNAAGHLRFDFAIYRRLDPAGRRLFLFLSKLQHRRQREWTFRLRAVAVDLLGFAPLLADKVIRFKVKRVLAGLMENGVLEWGEVKSMGKGNDQIALRTTVATAGKLPPKTRAEDSPAFAALLGLGFEEQAARRLVRQTKAGMLTEWIDITQAARERFGDGFFKKSPMAYLVDSLKHAERGQRTPPDWWRELQSQERREDKLGDQSAALLTRLRHELFPQFKEGESASTSQLQPLSDVLRRR